MGYNYTPHSVRVANAVWGERGVGSMHAKYEDDDSVTHNGYNLTEYVANVAVPHDGVLELVHVSTRAVLYLTAKSHEDERIRIISDFIKSTCSGMADTDTDPATAGAVSVELGEAGYAYELCIWTRRDDIAAFASTYMSLINSAARMNRANAHIRELETLFHTRRFFPHMLSEPIYSEIKPTNSHSSAAQTDAAAVYVIRTIDRSWHIIKGSVIFAIIGLLLMCVIKILID